MKIGIVSINYSKKGGSEHRTSSLVEYLISEGHEVIVFANKAEGIFTKWVKIPIFPVTSVFKVFSFVRNLSKVINKEGLDVLHCQIRPFCDGIVTLAGGAHKHYIEVVKKNSGLLKKILINLSPYNFYICFLEKRRFRNNIAMPVITNSQFAKNGITTFYPIKTDKIYVIYNGVDSNLFTPKKKNTDGKRLRSKLEIPENDCIILFVGNDLKRKGLGYLIKALSILKAKGMKKFRLLVVGNGKQFNYKLMAQKERVEKEIYFLKYSETIDEYYASADILVLPTIFDPFSNVVLEAMASGLPVITTYNNGASEIIEDGISGMIVKVSDIVNELVAKISFLESPAQRLKIGVEARRVAERFTWEKTNNEIMSLYKSIKNA